MKHCHTSQFGIVSASSCATREVLDIEIMSKHCGICKFHKSRNSIEETNLNKPYGPQVTVTKDTP